MYELWLGVNIIYEWCLMYPAIPLAMLAVLVAAYVLNRGKPKDWRKGFFPALVWAILGFIVLFFVYPMLIKSSIFEVKRLADWINHLGICAGLAGFVGLVFWPFMAARVRA